MGKFAENLNLGKHVLYPPPVKFEVFTSTSSFPLNSLFPQKNKAEIIFLMKWDYWNNFVHKLLSTTIELNTVLYRQWNAHNHA